MASLDAICMEKIHLYQDWVEPQLSPRQKFDSAVHAAMEGPKKELEVRFMDKG